MFYIVAVDKQSNAVKGYYDGIRFDTDKKYALRFGNKEAAELNASQIDSKHYNIGVLKSVPRGTTKPRTKKKS